MKVLIGNVPFILLFFLLQMGAVVKERLPGGKTLIHTISGILIGPYRCLVLTLTQFLQWNWARSYIGGSSDTILMSLQEAAVAYWRGQYHVSYQTPRGDITNFTVYWPLNKIFQLFQFTFLSFFISFFFSIWFRWSPHRIYQYSIF